MNRLSLTPEVSSASSCDFKNGTRGNVLSVVKSLLAVLGMVVWAPVVWSATFYIDPTCISSGNGTTTACGPNGPFKTWGEVSWAAGNTYSQRGGTTAYETITVGASGSAGKVITLNSYGTEKARLNGGEVIDPATWKENDPVPGVYSHDALGYGVFEDDLRMRVASSSTCTDAPYYYSWYSSSRSYYKPSSGTLSDRVLKKNRLYGIDLGTHDYITVTGFDISQYSYGIRGGASTGTGANSYITITDNSLSDLHFGIWLAFTQDVSSNVAITNNTFDYIRMSFEAQSNGDCRGGTGNFDTYDISYNSITNGNYIRGATYTWEDVNPLDWDEEGIGFQALTNSNVHDNTISGKIRGIVFFVCAGLHGNNNNFFRNYIHTKKDPFYFQPAAGAADFYNNLAYSNVLIGGGERGTAAFNVSSMTVPTPRYNYIYGNTIVGDGNGIYLQKNTDYYDIRNNIVVNAANWTAPIVMLSTARPAHLIIDYNLYFHGAESNWYVQWTTPTGKSWSAWRALGYDSNSKGGSVDPLFARVSVRGAAGEWVSEGNNVWSKAAMPGIGVVFNSTEVGRAAEAVTAKYRYRFANGRLYVYATANPTSYYSAIEQVSSLVIPAASPAKSAGASLSLPPAIAGGGTGSASDAAIPSIGAYEDTITAPKNARLEATEVK